MTVLQRAATIAAMTFTIAGMMGFSTPGLASDLDRTAIPVQIATLPTTNVPPAGSVPDEGQATPAAPVAVVAEPDFETLADAVAAQDAGVASDALRCLAGAVYFEAKGEPLAGQLAVANVIINRSKSGRFPSDVCSVVKQRGQFGFVRGGEIPAVREGSAPYRTALAVAKVALEAAWDSPAPRAMYFNTPNRVPGSGLTRIAMIGNHVFYR